MLLRDLVVTCTDSGCGERVTAQSPSGEPGNHTFPWGESAPVRAGAVGPFLRPEPVS